MMMNTTYQTNRFLFFTLLFLFGFAPSLSLTAQTIYYVDVAKANNDGDGLSWENAKKDLQVALDLATAGDEIRVASGTYLPTDAPGSTTDDRDKAFHLDKDVVLKGSYNPATDIQDYTNPTILSGDFMGTPDNDADNAYHVFVTFGLSSAAIIDGFTLSGGNANGSGGLLYGGQIFKSNGGGMYNRSSSPTITNSTFSGNKTTGYGGGMYNNYGSSPTITNSLFSGNRATKNGGGMFNESSSPIITNSIFSGNTATVDGGGMYNTISSSPTITDSSFSENSASDDGGGMYNTSSSPTITNSSFSGNTATTNGGGMYNQTSSLTITNSIFSGNSAAADGGGMLNASSSTTIINSTFVGNTGANGGGMRNYFSPSPILYNSVLYANTATNGRDIYGNAIHTDSSHNASDGTGGGIASRPGFVDLSEIDPFIDSTDPDGADGIFRTADDGLIPHATSPLIDAGDDTKNEEETDITGGVRIVGTAIDIGAYEFHSPCAAFADFSDVIVYVNHAATGLADGTSWADAFTELQPALDLAVCSEVTEIRVASGTYLPTDAPDDSTDDPRDRAFHLDKDLVLKGSYNPETDMQDYTDPSILSGDISSTPDNDDDNAYHVLVTVGLTATTIIDGFTFSDGNADGTGDLTYSSQTFFRDNGGGLYNHTSSPTITNSIFRGNSAADNGSGMLNEFSSPTITNSSFSGNSCGLIGGGMSNESSSPTINNSTFSGNKANSGGGMFNRHSSPKITNSTFVGNRADHVGGGLYNFSSTPTLYNTVFYANAAISGGLDINGDVIDESSSHNASDLTGGGIASRAGFVDLSEVADPFIDSTDPAGADGIFGTADDGLIPHGTSPLIDAGDDTKNDEETDITGGARVMDTAIDIGAYEGQSSLSSDRPVVETTALYPNPTSSEVYLSYSKASNVKYSLYDMAGKRLATYTQSGTAHQLDVSTVSKGTYILKATSGLQVNYYRIVKE